MSLVADLGKRRVKCFADGAGQVNRIGLTEVISVAIHPGVGDDGFATISADPLQGRDVQRTGRLCGGFLGIEIL
jgi:hypothetical protein